MNNFSGAPFQSILNVTTELWKFNAYDSVDIEWVQSDSNVKPIETNYYKKGPGPGWTKIVLKPCEGFLNWTQSSYSKKAIFISSPTCFSESPQFNKTWLPIDIFMDEEKEYCLTL